MLHYAVVFFLIAIVAAVFGFGGIAVGAAEIAKILFVIFLVLFLGSLVVGLLNREKSVAQAGRRIDAGAEVSPPASRLVQGERAGAIAVALFDVDSRSRHREKEGRMQASAPKIVRGGRIRGPMACPRGGDRRESPKCCYL